MSLIALLLAQTAVLDSRMPEAAVACAVAAEDRNFDDDTPLFRGLAQHLFYTTRAAQALPGDDALSTDVRALLQKFRTAPKPSGAERDAMLEECDRRFPLARKLEVVLPAETRQRDLTCVAVWHLIDGIAVQIKGDDADMGELRRLSALSPAINARMPAEDLAKRGADTPAKVERLKNEQYNASLEIGNIEAIARACEASLQG